MSYLKEMQMLKEQGHTLRLKKKQSVKDVRRYFSSRRVENRWNSLDQETVDLGSINSFKSRLDKIRKTRMGFLWILHGLQSPRPDGDGTHVRPHKVSYRVSYRTCWPRPLVLYRFNQVYGKNDKLSSTRMYCCILLLTEIYSRDSTLARLLAMRLCLSHSGTVSYWLHGSSSFLA